MTHVALPPLSVPVSEPARIPPGAAALAVFVVLSLACAVLSPGFVSADACAHYLFARYAFTDPVNLVDVWARPVCTLLYAVPALAGGRLGVRVCAIGVAVGCALVARSIAAAQGTRRPALAMLFTLGGPLFFLFSFAEMTELPFALIMGGAFLAYQRRRWVAMAVLAGLLPAVRPEGFGFVLLGLAALLLHRRWLWISFLLLPLIAWDVAGWAVTGKPCPWYLWLIRAWPWSEQSLYGRGSIFTFVAALPLIVPPLVLPGTVAGIGLGLRRAGRVRELAYDHDTRCRFLVAAIPVAVLVVHSVLRAMGKFGSFGEARYLLIAAPLWGVCSAHGWEWISQRLGRPTAWRWAVAAVCAPALVNLFYPVVPVRLSEDWQAASRFADAYTTSGVRERLPRLIAAHPGVHYFLELDPTAHARRDAFTRTLVAARPPGAVLVWDPVLSDRNATTEDAATLDFIRSAGWVPDIVLTDATNARPTAATDPAAWHVFKSPALPDPR